LLNEYLSIFHLISKFINILYIYDGVDLINIQVFEVQKIEILTCAPLVLLASGILIFSSLSSTLRYIFAFFLLAFELHFEAWTQAHFQLIQFGWLIKQFHELILITNGPLPLL